MSARRLTRAEKLINQVIRTASVSGVHEEQEIAAYLRDVISKASKEFRPSQQEKQVA